MLIDTHMHEMTYSKDSFLKLDEMVRIARAKGLTESALQIMTAWGLRNMQQNIPDVRISRSLQELNFSPCRVI